MDCESCIVMVKEALLQIGATPTKVGLGEVVTKENLTPNQMADFKSKIQKVGLELLEKKNDLLVERIKEVIRDFLFKTDSKHNLKLSTVLSEELGFDYAYLANLFSESENGTIESYLITSKIEHAKTLLLQGEFTVAEIANALHYSSPAHLSNQFKKFTGLSPSQFRGQEINKNIAI